jgi:uncharacterized protein YdgA (DUF945 family)
MGVDNVRGQSGLMLGNRTLTIDNVDINWLDETPLHLIFNQIAYGSKLTEADAYINGEGKFNVASFMLDNKHYGPVRFLGEAKHLHAPTLAVLTKEIAQLQKDGLTTGAVTDAAVLEVFRKSGFPLLEHNPELAIRELFVKTPDGDIQLSASIGIRGFEKADIDFPLALFNKINANAQVSIPRQVLEAMIVLQTQMMLGNDQGNNSEDMRLLIGQIVEGQINKLAQEKYIHLRGNNITTHAILKAGNLTLNGVPVVLPWQQPITSPKQ